MKVTVEISVDSVAFEDNFEGELRRVIGQIPCKVEAQLAREHGCICTAPERDDLLFDHNGNTVGTVSVQKENSDA